MLRRIALACFATLALAWPARATWSIVLVDRATGEVAVGAATCLARLNLLEGLPVIRVGQGAGAIQAFSGGEAGLVIMFQMLGQGASPQTILSAVQVADPRPQSRQIGIVGMGGPPVTFTGTAAGAAKGGVVGEVGDLAYAIQGNVLAGAQVWLDAEAALLATPGDLGLKLMAAMEAARAQGGDGRCSCSLSRPQSCGTPPAGFTKSAHCGFMVVSRIGDRDATCSNGFDCADGVYFMKLNIRGNRASQSAPDPVLQLKADFDAFRLKKAGIPDHLNSRVEAPQSLPADGVTTREVYIRLVDLGGVPLTEGGDLVTVSTLDGLPPIASPGPVTDHGDGTYSFTLTAGTQPGMDTFVIKADDPNQKAATLYPYLGVRSDPVEALHVGYDQVSAASPARVPFVLNLPGRGGAPYVIAASLTGTEPGSWLLEVPVPLNPPLISVLRDRIDAARLPGSVGRLDPGGRAEAAFVPGSAQLLPLVGRRVDWAGVVLTPDGPVVTNATGFTIVP